MDAILDFLQATLPYCSNRPRLAMAVIGAVFMYCIPKLLAVATKSRLPRFSAACDLICLDIIKAIRVLTIQVKAVPPAAIMLVALSLLLPLQGCSMSLERARSDGASRRAALTPPAQAATRDECANLDKIQRYWGYAGYGTAPVAPFAAGIGVVPGIGDDARSAMLVTAGVAAAAAVFEFAEQQNFENQWVTQGCGQ